MTEESRPPFSWVNVPTPEAERTGATRGLLRALCDPERLETAFQPVFRARTGELEGCEALLRIPAGSGFSGPGEAFTVALAEGLGGDLEAAAIQRALRDAEPFAGHRLVFLNLLATSLEDPRLGARWLLERAVAHGRVPSQLILELGQISRIVDYPALARALEPYRAEGFRIAIDDFGAGYTNLRMITDLAPDFVKLDSVFVKDVFVHARKRVLVESVVSLCHRINCGVIAEGIETPDDLETCLGAGVDLLQGFLLARPGAPEEAFVAEDLTVEAVGGRGRGEIAAAVSRGPTLPVEAPLAEAEELFRAEPDLDVVPVLQRGRAVGLLARDRVETFRFGSRGSGDDTVAAAIADAPWDQIEEGTPVEEVATFVARRPRARRFEPVVVTGPGRAYRGLLRLDDLLGLFARLYVENGLESHPLTDLPGRGRLEAEVDRRLTRGAPFALARLNILRLRAFNDRYGVRRGDRLLAHVAAVLRTLATEEPGSFLAHYGADDFGFLLPPERVVETTRRAVQGIGATVGEFYDPEDLSAGGIAGHDARGGAILVAPAALVAGVAFWGGGETPTLRTVVSAAEAALREARRGGTQPVVRTVGPAAAPAATQGRADEPPRTQTSLPKPYR